MLSAPSQPTVVIAMNCFRPGGSQTYALELANRFSEAGASVHLIGKNGPWTAKAKGSGIVHTLHWREGTAIQKRGPGKALLLRFEEHRAARRLRDLLSNSTLVITSQPWPAHFIQSYAHRYWPNVKHVALVHGVTPVEWPLPRLSRFAPGINSFLAATPETFVAITQTTPQTHVALAGNLFSGTKYWEATPDELLRNYQNDGPIVTIGTLTENKTEPIYALLASIAGSSQTVTIVGDGPERERLERHADSLGLREQVHFVGSVDDPRPYILAASVVVAGGRGALESLSAGRPTIVATTDGLHGLVRIQDFTILEGSNFTGRTSSSVRSSPENIRPHIEAAFEISEQERTQLTHRASNIGSFQVFLDLLGDRA